MWKSKSMWTCGVLAASLLALSGCDERCSTRNCRAMMRTCGVALRAEPAYELCNYTPDRDQRESYCPAACVASNSGEVLECFWDSDSSCDDSAGREAVARSCTSSVKPGTPACMSKCATERTTCEQKCVTDGGAPAGDCMDCAKRCGLALGRCETACREAS